MISSKNIRFHAPSNTYIIPKNSVIDQNVAVKGNLIVGSGSRFWKNIKVDGIIQFGKGCLVEGNLRAGQVIFGSRSKIKGNIIADADVTLLQNSIVRSAETKGNITIMPGCFVGYANGSTLQVIGKAEIKKIGVITKVTVRADTIIGLKDEPKEAEDLEFIIGDQIQINDNDEIQNISEELIFENGNENNNEDNNEDKKIDDKILISENDYKNKINTESDANSFSQNTPAFQLEQMPDNQETGPENNIKSDESLNVEIIDETDENSSQTFSFSEFKTSAKDQPVNVPTDETDEVEIVLETIDSNSDNSNGMIPKTVETPFGTIVVGEQPAPAKAGKSESDKNNQFASVTEISKEEQQADYEAELCSKKPAAESKSVSAPKSFVPESKSSVSESKSASELKPVQESNPVEPKSKPAWPPFEPHPIKKKTNAFAAAGQPERKEAPAANRTASAANYTAHSANRPAASGNQIQYEEVKIQNTPKPANPAGTDPASLNADSNNTNQKVVFEEVSQTAPKTKTPADSYTKSETKPEMKSTEKQEIKPETEHSREEIERSKAWYEERHHQNRPKKKEYPPYI